MATMKAPSIMERVARSFARVAGLDVVAKAAPKNQAPYATAIARAQNGRSTKRGARQLRNFSETNEWVRMAINRRKHALGQAKWQIVRTDDPSKPVNPKLVDEIKTLLRYTNSRKDSFRTLLEKTIEDVLVLDAGCIEKQRNVGGRIIGLWDVAGETIAVDPKWDGSKPNAPRYAQYENYRKVADFKNDDLIYMMHNPRSISPVGWSPVETLVRVIEAELYAENYDYDMLQQNAPAGLLDLGSGVGVKEMEAFREYYENQIAGTQNVAIIGGGLDAQGNAIGGTAKYIPFKNDTGDMREAYKKFLALKICGVFEMDLSSFNLVENVNKANGGTMAAQTDVGLVGLGSMIAEYITREIVWEFDENHGFEFDGLVIRDQLTEAKIDQIHMMIGYTFPNELRTRDGLDKVDWGDVPWSPAKAGTFETEPEAPDGAAGEDPAAPPADGDAQAKGAAKAIAPFGAARRGRTPIARPS